MKFREFSAYEDQINLTLLNDIIRFISDTASLTSQQTRTLHSRCVLLTYDTVAGTLQEKYGFLYLGELLERFEERHGMPLSDLRAIALALGYTKDITTEDMFVGTQHSDFIQKVRQRAENDIYLLGALYLIHEGQSSEFSEQLEAYPYTKTEELLFALSLYDDFAAAFVVYKPQLLKLMTTDRTLPVVGNSRIYNWLITRLLPVLKANRGKDMLLFRSLCALPTSNVKPGSRHHTILLQHGYSPLEISYANTMVIQHQTADGVLSRHSIVTEKVIIGLFRTALSAPFPLSEDGYQQLTELFDKYKKFKIRCFGFDKLIDALNEETVITDPKTFIWFCQFATISHPVFSGFDIMDPRWDSLATDMELYKYTKFFEQLLHKDMDALELEELIDRFDTLTGTSYISSYWENNRGSLLGLLVEKGLIDLWQAFTSSLDDDGNVKKQQMVDRISSYLHGIQTVQAFRFYEQFLSVYGFAGMDRYLHNTWDFTRSLIDMSRYNDNAVGTLTLLQDYLDDEMRLTAISWLEEYYFTRDPKFYLGFVVAVLKSSTASDLLPPQERRTLFDLVIKQEDLVKGLVPTLRAMHLTAEELEADKQAKEAERQAREEKEQQAIITALQGDYEKRRDDSVAELVHFLECHSYPRERRGLAHHIVQENLPTFMEKKDHKIAVEDSVELLDLCTRLVRWGSMSYTDAQKLISTTTIKEAA